MPRHTREIFQSEIRWMRKCAADLDVFKSLEFLIYFPMQLREVAFGAGQR